MAIKTSTDQSGENSGLLNGLELRGGEMCDLERKADRWEETEKIGEPDLILSKAAREDTFRVQGRFLTECIEVCRHRKIGRIPQPQVLMGRRAIKLGNWSRGG